MEIHIKNLLEEFSKYKSSEIPFHDDSYPIHEEAAWVLEKKNVVLFKKGGLLCLTERGKHHIDRLIEFEGDLEEYEFNPVKRDSPMV